jgi:hypothetical protein
MFLRGDYIGGTPIMQMAVMVFAFLVFQFAVMFPPCIQQRRAFQLNIRHQGGQNIINVGRKLRFLLVRFFAEPDCPFGVSAVSVAHGEIISKKVISSREKLLFFVDFFGDAHAR